jgi:hypothetical protein
LQTLPSPCHSQIRAELAEKELILLEKEKELLEKEQTVVVLKEEVRVCGTGCQTEQPRTCTTAPMAQQGAWGSGALAPQSTEGGGGGEGRS